MFHANFSYLVEVVLVDQDTAFLVSTPDEGLKIVTEVMGLSKDQVLVPPKKEHILFVLLDANKILNCKYNITTLYRDLVDKLREVSRLPSEPYYHLCAVYIFLSFLNRQANYYPYLWFYGLPERGKSRIVRVMSDLVYRGFYTETLNPAPLFRFADAFGGTIVLDLYEISKTAKVKDAYDFLLGRFQQGIKVARVINIEKGPYQDVKYYEVYGPTIIATNENIPNRDPLRSRCIQIVMPEARGKYRNIDFQSELLPLKAGLLRFRANHMHHPLPDVEKPTVGRLGDIMQPLCAMSRLLPEEANINLYELIEEIQTTRMEAEADSLPGQIMEVLFNHQVEGRQSKLKVAEVCRELNNNRDDKIGIGAQEVGSNLAAMGIKRRKSNGVMHIIWEEQTIQDLFGRYGFDSNNPSLLSLASLSPEKIENEDNSHGETGREGSESAPGAPSSKPAKGQVDRT